MSEPAARLTLVTALFDLAGREGNTGRRAPADYLRHGEYLFQLDEDVVFVVDPDFERTIRERRCAHGLSHRTVVIPRPFESLPYHGLVPAIADARRRHPVHNASPLKDTALYIALTWSKFSLVREVLARDLFACTHVAWIDLGIAQVADTRHCRQDALFRHPSEGVRLLMMRKPLARELTDLAEYYSYVRGHLAAGFVTASGARFAELSTVFDEAARSALAQGFGPSEEQLLVVLALRRPELFEFYYGDYPAILANHRRLRQSAENLLFQMRLCREARDWEGGCDIGARVLASHRDGTFASDPAHLSALLDEYFIAAYYREYPGQTIAREVAEYYASLVRSAAPFRSAFVADREHILSNFSFLREPVAL